MATSTAGLGDLVAAFTGGGQIEDAAYSRSAARLMAAQNAQADMDKKVQEAALLKDQLRSRGNFERNSMDLDPMSRFAALAGMGSDYNQSQQGAGHGLKNEATAEALKLALANGDVDAINRLIGVSGNKLLAPTNVNVGPQSQANLSKTQQEIQKVIAEIGMTNAATQENQAQAAKYRSETSPGGSDLQGLKPSGLDQQIMDALYIKEDVPNPDYDPDAWFWNASPTKGKEDVDLVPEFLVFQAKKSETDPRYLNSDYALAQFMMERAKVKGSATTTPRPNNRRYLYNPATGDFQEQ